LLAAIDDTDVADDDVVAIVLAAAALVLVLAVRATNRREESGAAFPGAYPGSFRRTVGAGNPRASRLPRAVGARDCGRAPAPPGMDCSGER